MCEQLNLDASKFGRIYLDSMNLEYDKLSLPEVGQCDYTHEQNRQTYYEYQLTKEHRNVCRDIDNLNATYGQRGYAQIEQTPYTHEQNGQIDIPEVGDIS